MRPQGDSQGAAGTQKLQDRASPMERTASLWGVLEKKNGLKRHPSLALGVFFRGGEHILSIPQKG